MSAITVVHQTLGVLEVDLKPYSTKGTSNTALILVGDGALISYQISQLKVLTKMWMILNIFSAEVM